MTHWHVLKMQMQKCQNPKRLLSIILKLYRLEYGDVYAIFTSLFSSPESSYRGLIYRRLTASPKLLGS